MSKIKHTLAAALFTVASAASSQAAPLIAGWDFNQFYSDAVLSLDGATAAPANIAANYSSFDPNGAGSESAAYGTMRLPFQPVGDASEPFLPTAGNLLPNQAQGPYNNQSVTQGENPFAVYNDLAMVATSPISIVFEAHLLPTQVGTDWQVTLAGATLGVSAGTISIEFSTDGVAYASLGTQNVTSNAISLTVAPQAVSSGRALFRLTLSQGVTIDNLGISGNVTAVPEPLLASLLAAGLGGLAFLGRRRAA